MICDFCGKEFKYDGPFVKCAYLLFICKRCSNPHSLACSKTKEQLINIGSSLAFGLIIIALTLYFIWATWPLCDPIMQWVFDFVEGR